MADDRQEVPAKSPKAPSAIQSAIAHRPDSKPASNKWRGWAYKHWHAIMFLIFFVISVAAGFYYRWESDPGAEPTDFKNQAPQYLNVYLSYGQHFLASTVSVEIDLDNSQFSPFTNDFSPNLNVDGFTKFIEYVTVTVKSAHPIPQGTIVITSTSKPSDLNYVEDRSVPGPPEFVLATSLSPDALLNSGGQYGAIAVAAFLPVPIIWEGHGSIYSHLPSVGVIQYSNGNIPNVLAEFERRTGRLVRAQVDLGGSTPPYTPPFASGGIPPADLTESFWGLASLSATEEIANIGPQLNSDQIDYMNPPTTVSNFNYQWQSTGCCNLEPIFKLTDPEVADSQNRDAFISGIAFGVAGAAAIAVVQELPKELHWPRRQRRPKSPPLDAEANARAAAVPDGSPGRIAPDT